MPHRCDGSASSPPRCRCVLPMRQTFIRAVRLGPGMIFWYDGLTFKCRRGMYMLNFARHASAAQGIRAALAGGLLLPSSKAQSFERQLSEGFRRINSFRRVVLILKEDKISLGFTSQQHYHARLQPTSLQHNRKYLADRS